MKQKSGINQDAPVIVGDLSFDPEERPDSHKLVRKINRRSELRCPHPHPKFPGQRCNYKFGVGEVPSEPIEVFCKRCGNITVFQRL